MHKTQAQRTEREIFHGRFLAAHDAERIWGWNTQAGRLRAERRAALIAEGGGLCAGIRCLEIGCGTGLFTEHFASTGAHILAVDISRALLDVAIKRDFDPERVQFLEEPFESCEVYGPFDAVIGSSIIHHLYVEASIRKIYHLLKPGGVMCFAEPNMLNPQIFFQKNVPWLKMRLGDSPDETAFIRWPLDRLLRGIGFAPVYIRPFDWLHPQTPNRLIPYVQRIGQFLESIPLISNLAGSLLIRAYRPF